MHKVLIFLVSILLVATVCQLRNERAERDSILAQVRANEADQLKADAAWFEAGCEWSLIRVQGQRVAEAAHSLCEQAELQLALKLSEGQTR